MLSPSALLVTLPNRAIERAYAMSLRPRNIRIQYDLLVEANKDWRRSCQHTTLFTSHHRQPPQFHSLGATNIHRSLSNQLILEYLHTGLYHRNSQMLLQMRFTR